MHTALKQGNAEGVPKLKRNWDTKARGVLPHDKALHRITEEGML